MKPTHTFKILLLGEGAVGKSSLILKFVEGKFKTDYKITLGADFLSKNIKVYNYLIKLTIWDISGQSRFSSFKNLYYTGVSGILLVYDVTRPDTLKKLLEWTKDVKNFSKGSISTVLIGNKVDLEKKVTNKQLNEYKKKLNSVKSLQTSAKSGAGVEDAFFEITRTIVDRVNIQTQAQKVD